MSTPKDIPLQTYQAPLISDEVKHEATGVQIIGNEIQQQAYANNASNANPHYEENMEPWKTDPNGSKNYYFAGSTIKKKKKKCCILCRNCCGYTYKQNCICCAPPKGEYSVSIYHKLDSKRLIIKKKEYSGTKSRKCVILGLFITFISGCLILIGLASALLEANAAPWLAFGVIGCIFGIILTLMKATSDRYTMLTQSIPINSIFYVERDIAFQSASCCDAICNLCCCERIDATDHTSDVSIGYNRSNLSAELKVSGYADTTDYITLNLFVNVAYNLHQYINDIIDGNHPHFNNVNVDCKYSDDNHLPKVKTS